MALCPLAEANQPSTIKNNGPYGAGVFFHRASTGFTNWPEPMVPGP